MDYLSGKVLLEMKARAPASSVHPVYATKGRTVSGGRRLAGDFPPRPSGFMRSSCRRLREPDGGYIIGPTAPYSLYVNNGTPLHVTLGVPGEHNALNAAAAIAGLHALAGIDPAEAAEALAEFTGTSRRFELRGERDGVWVVDDYAHHPTEVSATIAAARAWAPRRVVVCFQPHLFSRTEALALRFGQALAAADEVVVTEIYPARELPVAGVDAKLVVDAVSETRPGMPLAYEPTLEAGASYLRGRLRRGDLLVTMGAGDVRRVGDLLLEDG